MATRPDSVVFRNFICAFNMEFEKSSDSLFFLTFQIYLDKNIRVYISFFAVLSPCSDADDAAGRAPGPCRPAAGGVTSVKRLMT